MPSASESMATAAKPGFRRRSRAPNRKSCQISFTGAPPSSQYRRWRTAAGHAGWREFRLGLRSGLGAAGEVLEDLARFHDEDDAADGGGIAQRIAVHSDDVGVHAGRDGTDLILQAEGFGGEGRGRGECGQGILASITNAHDELFIVAAVGARDSVGAVKNL